MNGSLPFPASHAMFLAPGLAYHPAYLDRPAQLELVAILRDIVAAAPLFTPRMPKTGKACRCG